MVHDNDNIDPYLSGEQLYGDDLSGDALTQWFRDEESSYYEMLQDGADDTGYGYHALNYIHGFRWLPDREFRHLLGVGGATGEEFRPVLGKVGQVTVLEPAEGFVRENIDGVPAHYVKPVISGDLPFPDACFDLVTCFGVLHHIPNVTKVVRELARCIEPGGYMLVREPIISMGDWRKPRPGLTRHERGIPLHLFRSILNEAGFSISRETRCMFPLMPRLGRLLGRQVYGSRLLTRIDHMFSLVTQMNQVYHRRKLWQKLAPVSVFFVLQRQQASAHANTSST